MPPPRRRRPVQPATRVRLPRTARPRVAPATETGAGGAPATGPGEAVQTDRRPGGAGTDEAAAGRAAAGEAATGETATDQEAADQEAADETATGEPATGETATDQEAADQEAADENAADTGPAAGTGTARPGAAGRGAAPARRHPLALPASLGALAVILGGLAVWFALAASSATSGVDTSNVALTDPAATRQVSQQVASAVNTIFSYNYADTARTSRAAAILLTGRAKGEYDTLFRLVRQDAPKEKLVLTTTVTNAGVEYLTGSRARVLIFANQRDTAGAARNTTEAGAMFAVNAVNQGGRWKITGIDTFHPGG